MASVSVQPCLTGSSPSSAGNHVVDLPVDNLSDDDVVKYVFGQKDAIDATARIFIDAKNDSNFITYREAKKGIDSVARALISQGLRAGDCVSLHSFNDIGYPLFWLGIVSAGGVVTGANPAYSHSEIVHHLEVTNAKFIISHTACHDAVAQAAQACGIDQDKIFVFGKVDSGVHGSLKSWTTLLHRDGGDLDHTAAVPDRATRHFELAAYAATSGTTGLPKAAKLTHRFFIEQLMVIEQLFVNRTGPVIQLHCLPMFHSFAGPLAMLLPLRLGLPTYLLPRYHQEDFVDAVRRYRITDTALVPAIIAQLSKIPQPQSFQLNSLRFVLCAGAPLSSTVQVAFIRALSFIPILSQCWGCTELGWMTVFGPDEQDYSGSTGRLLPNTVLKIVGDDGNVVKDDNVRGQAFVRSSSMFAGYLVHRDAAMPQGLHDSEGFYDTGDIVYVKLGRVYVTGRAKDVMKVNGWQVSPEEIQNVVMELQQQGIQDCAIEGWSTIDSNGLQVTMPRAYVVKSPGSTLTANDIKAHVKKQLISYKQITGGVVFVDKIPRNQTGKILRHLLGKANVVEQSEAEHGIPMPVNEAASVWRYALAAVMIPLSVVFPPLAVVILNAVFGIGNN